MSPVRIVGIGLGGLLLGFLIAGGAAWAYLSSPAGKAFMRDLLTAAPSPTETTTPTPTTNATGTATSSAVAFSTVLVPKAYGTENYFIAINNIAADLRAIDDVNKELAPVLSALNAMTLSCTYGGFYEKMRQALVLAEKNKTLAAQFTAHVTALAAANTQTPDALTKSLTAKAVVSGQALGASLQTFAAAIQDILNGDTPDSATLAAFNAQTSATRSASAAFAADLKPLLERFASYKPQ